MLLRKNILFDYINIIQKITMKLVLSSQSLRMYESKQSLVKVTIAFFRQFLKQFVEKYGLFRNTFL